VKTIATSQLANAEKKEHLKWQKVLGPSVSIAGISISRKRIKQLSTTSTTQPWKCNLLALMGNKIAHRGALWGDCAGNPLVM